MYYSSKYRSGHAAGGERWPASPRRHSLAGTRAWLCSFFCLAEPPRIFRHGIDNTRKDPDEALSTNPPAITVNTDVNAADEVEGCPAAAQLLVGKAPWPPLSTGRANVMSH